MLSNKSSTSPTVADATQVHPAGFKAHVTASVPSPGRILSSAMWAEHRRTHCTSPGRWGGNWVKALGQWWVNWVKPQEREDRRRQGSNPAQQSPKTRQHLPQNFSTAFFFHLNSFPSFPLVQPPIQVVLHHAKWAQQNQLQRHQPTWHSIGLTSSVLTMCKPSQNLS